MCDNRSGHTCFTGVALDDPIRGAPMSKRARKRRTRKGSKANHGRRPNA
ncbi:hypothetical protein ATL31_0885 [Phycicoccus duodecadis]|uniref:Uncharacterized protein n=1 Tax=Phycicoccus duodecadis TaxID=173053 RepID=A0A2N3YGX1_9MICO|nr:hypothetical protein ATL31_0885 [Phycicoccus duodecadis]